MARQTKPTAIVTEPPPEPEYTLADETGGSLLAAAERVFGDDITALDVPEGRTAWHPDAGDMITVQGGGLYLPVRKRVQWMRQEPVPRPDWGIDTEVEVFVPGKLVGSGRAAKVEGGYARVRASIYNEDGRLIASGVKTEYSERFMDFVEKAETGAIGRALAVAGFGTEAAVDLDEGLEQERIADAPVDVKGRPISITPSSIPGLRQGGRSEHITTPQLTEIARLSKERRLGASGLASIINDLRGEQVFPDGAEATDEGVAAELTTWSFDMASQLIQRLQGGTELGT